LRPLKRNFQVEGSKGKRPRPKTKNQKETTGKFVKLRLPKIIPRETLAMALDSVRANKFRSFLTVLGIVIGVMAAIVVASILTGMRQSIISIIEEYGTNNIYAFHLTTGPRTTTDRAERLRKPLTVADAEAVKLSASSVEDLAIVSPNVGYNGGPFDDNI